MTSEDVRKLTVQTSNSLRDVMACINRNARGIALVVDDEFRLVNTITDGDVRRAILDGVGLDAPATELLVRKRQSPYPEPIRARQGTERARLLELIHEHSIRQIPLVDDGGRVVGLVTADDLLPEEVLPIQAVVMAGGFGTRLRPLTEELPKPMLPVGDRPLLELIIQQLQFSGVRQVNITTHYKPETITEHFGDGSQFGVQLSYVSEVEPLGTAGALGLLERPETPLLVMNGDILTRLDIRAFLAYHYEHKADLTVAVRQYDLNVPYGVLETEGVQVRCIREKPTYSFFVNAGVYLLDPTVYRYIPRDRKFDMTDLIELLLAEGHTVVSFPIVEYWLDIGQHADYVRAQEDYKNGRLHS